MVPRLSPSWLLGHTGLGACGQRQSTQESQLVVLDRGATPTVIAVI